MAFNLKTFFDSFPQPIGIVGLGISGLATKQLFDSLKISTFTFDSNPGKGQYFDKDKFLNLGCKTWILSPGIDPREQWIQSFISSGGTLTSEMDIASFFLEKEILIGVTGSVGKSTTTSLLGHSLLLEDPNAFIGGNLGEPLISYINAKIFGSRPKAKFICLEVSSFQLDLISKLKLKVSAITSLNPNHLERYASLEAYYQSKFKILSLTEDSIVLNSNGFDLKTKFPQSCKLKTFWEDRNSEVLKVNKLENPKIVGLHNKDNLAVAAKLAELLKIKTISQMSEYAGLHHRLENVGKLKLGVQFINDSKATSIESVIEATKSLTENIDKCDRFFLLIGGRDKNLPWKNLSVIKNIKNLNPIFFGECGHLAKQQSTLSGDVFSSLKEALNFLSKQQLKNDLVVLSPGGTSLDEFKNFSERGDYFKQWALQF